jgi:DNA-binding MarR family transcriptional regulator
VTTNATSRALERLVFAGVALTSRALAEATPGLELTLPQWRALVVLGEAPDGARVSEVASRVGGSLPGTSRLLRRLERRGLVSAQQDDRDHRATRVRLTPDGRSVRSAIFGYRRRIIRRVARAATPSLELTAELERLAAAIGEVL